MYAGIEILYPIRIASFFIAILFPVLIYWYTTRNYDYWKKRGVPYAKPYPFFVYYLELLIRGVEVVERERYTKLGRIYGFFEGNAPQISVGDPELIRDILVKDFSVFINKRLPTRYTLVGINDIPIGDPIADNMVTNIRGDEWRRIRNVITAAFTTGKLKRMMSIIQDCSKSLIRNFKDELKNGSTVEIVRMYGALSMDVIASAAFSTKVESLKNPDSPFVKKANGASNPNLRLPYVLVLLAPKLLRQLGFVMYSSENNFFKQLFLEIIEGRKKTGQTRNDFLQLMMDAAKETEKEDNLEEITDSNTDNYNYESYKQSHFKGVGSKQLTFDELVAQCVIFLLAGYHTTKTTLGVATYLLALHQDEQEKLFNEIKEVLKETKGVLTYEAIKKMKHMDNVISESLRMYPAPIKTERQCGADYKLGDTGITIPKGMAVHFPILSMHRDPEFFPEPEKFKPSRFSPEERGNIIPYSYMPFGFGPRNCIGMRFALLELKIVLTYFFSVFSAHKCPETEIPLDTGNGMAVLNLSPTHLRLEERKDCPLIL